jgi:hypothetical protein
MKRPNIEPLTIEAAIRDICRPWNSRVRIDREVLGAIELAYRRGLHAGSEQRQAARTELRLVMEPDFRTVKKIPKQRRRK